ncbi:MAG TPA: VWA domain-containing protein [Verrucomicrobiales bacterium]|nr:VWA domain-containing protein [Verrucomicrobiales bacterium]
MSFLFPLYLAGLAALAIPVALHFRHRHTREKVRFSTLMFLSPTPIREKRNRRLENLLLLLLRCALLALIALAFARPFLKQENPLVAPDDGRTVAILIDRSASMRREDLWERAKQEVRREAGGLQLGDALQLAAFGDRTDLLISFDQWERAPLESERQRLVEAALETLQPSWERTRTVEALAAAAGDLESHCAELGGDRTRELVLISDFQRGEGFETLEQHDWPANMRFRPVPLEVHEPANASLQVLPREQDARLDEEPRRRARLLANAATKAGAVQLTWITAASKPLGQAVPVQIIPGASRIAEAPAFPTNETPAALALDGDTHDFDNRWYVSPPPETPFRILYYGPGDAASPDGNLFFLRRALLATPSFRPELVERTLDQSLEDLDLTSFQLTVATGEIPDDSLELLLPWLDGGGRILYLLDRPEAALALTRLAGAADVLAAEEVVPADYAVISTVNRAHPLLEPFADARFGDFTRLHFWRYRRVDPAAFPSAEVIASFDTRDPLWLEQRAGAGSLLVFTSGWGRRDSQLAVSSKFIPLLFGIFQQSRGNLLREPVLWIGDPIPLPSKPGVVITPPDGVPRAIAEGAATWTETGEPGIYVVEAGVDQIRYAVNLHPAESQLEEVEPAVFERALSRSGNADQPAVETGSDGKVRRILTAFDREAQQKIWWYLLLAALGLVLVEILYAARCHGRQQAALQEG